jgi:hypothetical protein
MGDGYGGWRSGFAGHLEDPNDLGDIHDVRRCGFRHSLCPAVHAPPVGEHPDLPRSGNLPEATIDVRPAIDRADDSNQ